MVVMNVASGSLNDSDVPGIGHALEHFLLMGSTKYPCRDEFGEHVSKHSGLRIGTTKADNTQFWFNINTDAADPEAGAKLEEVLNVFLYMFIDPTFEADSVERKMKAIESEFEHQVRVDRGRLAQVSRSLSNPEHPMAGEFPFGNRKLLGDPAELLPKVIEHKKHYSASLIQCVVLSLLPIPELQGRFAAALATIPNRGVHRKVWGTILRFLEKDLGTETFVESVENHDYLYISFYFPGNKDDGYSAQGGHAVDLLTQKAEGSLYDVLCRQQLVHSLSANMSYKYTGYRTLMITARLTKAGLSKYTDMVQGVYCMIARMKAQGPQQQQVDEQTRLRHIDFCTSQTPDMSLAINMAEDMLYTYLCPENLVYHSNEILAASRFNADEIVRTLDQLQPQNMRLVLLSTKFSKLATKEEKWYRTRWGTRKMPSDNMAKYAAAVALPCSQLPPEPRLLLPNQFITKHDFEAELLVPQQGRPAQAQATALAGEDEEEKQRPPRALWTDKTDIWFAPGEGLWAEP
ncbi:hypothetical protein B7494_g4275 [Chlorociboria aeruginascens]|nr:hypothetical protein B7494_g4275 [Chlorociboria aeruginascens]